MDKPSRKGKNLSSKSTNLPKSAGNAAGSVPVHIFEEQSELATRVKPFSKNSPRQLPLWLWIGVVFGLFWIGIGLFLFLKSSADTQQIPFSELTSPDYHSLAFNPAAPNIVFFGSHTGLLRSTDGGRTWQPTTLRDQDAMQIGVADDGKTIIISGHDVFQKSSDGGQTWQNMIANLQGATDIHAMAFDPANPNNLYFMAVGVGLIKSSNGGLTWTALPNSQVGQNILALAYGSNTLWASTSNRSILRSQDGGQTWQPASGFVNGALDAGLKIVSLSYDQPSNTLYAGTDNGVYRSTDGGNSWNKLSYKGVALAVATNGQTLLVLNEKGEIYRSRNNGVSWNG
jgi:photosystem II stability/assembly factor-like uncharacterized protein